MQDSNDINNNNNWRKRKCRIITKIIVSSNEKLLLLYKEKIHNNPSNSLFGGLPHYSNHGDNI